MIFQGRYENDAGIFRPYISADVLSLANEWVTVDFLVDSGVPYFQIDSTLKLISPGGTKVFKGKINVFLDPHASEVPLLGRDVLDNFVVIFDRKNNYILLLDEEEKQYKELNVGQGQ